MLKNIVNLKGSILIEKSEQKVINGGFGTLSLDPSSCAFCGGDWIQAPTGVFFCALPADNTTCTGLARLF